MLVEIPDPEVILGVIGAFLAGLFVFFIAYKLKPLMSLKSNSRGSYDLDRLEYYEKQLIDMKIRLDAQDVMNDIEKPTVSVPKTHITLIDDNKTHTPSNLSTQSKRLPKMGHGDVTTHVLRLITRGPMTSRDIQISIGRSREHTSRLMKKFFQEGYVQRNTNSKPYTYSITDKGKGKASLLQHTQ